MISLSVILFSGCVSKADEFAKDSYPLQHAAASGESSSATASVQQWQTSKIADKFEHFVELFSEFKAADMRPRVEAVYAEDLYFNDTLHSATSREHLIDYMQKTADNIKYTNVNIKDIVQSGDDYYVRWSMDTGFTALGKEIETHSIGMTQVRFNDQGKVNFHQDFWDNTEGFFRHLPIFGFLVGQTKKRL